ncbi:MAG TPA: aminoacyl-tRNA hydrolase [Bacteroidota bacterium]|nr:aminoacyl-tRNA hydrolase [Bacteroidota bacterium]
MVFIIGLGNPGSPYDGTRHNVGFEVVDRLAETLNTQFKPGKGEYLEALTMVGGEKVGLVKPLTYMNNSGSAVVDIQERYEVPLDRLLVVCDDFWLPLGTLRLRPKGSDGGHNGLYSIIYHLQSESFPRLRCGIASESIPQNKERMAEFVLDRFTTTERPVVNRMVKRAAEACVSFIQHGIQKTMTLYNTQPAA